MQSNNGHKRAVLYGRVSTDEQADKGYSLPSQFDAMRKYAAQEGLEIVGEFQDDYSGATPIEFRPEGGKAYAMLKTGGADAIIAYRIDRYVRPPEDGDEWDLPVLIRGLAKLGKEIHVCNRGKLKTDFADLLIAMLDARKAGEERRDIRERSMRGKRQKVKSGKVVGLRAPYGYRHIRDEHGKVVMLEIDEPTARIVRLIFRWYVDGDETGKRLSAEGITKRLSIMRVTTPGEIGKGYNRKKKSGYWNINTVLAIISNETYCGIYRYGSLIGTTKQRRPIEETVTVNVPPIIDRATWERSQAQRKINKAMSLRNCKHNYLLRGMLHCSCGKTMVGDSHQGNLIYTCSSHRTCYRELGQHPCKGGRIRAEAIEYDIWSEILGLFSDLVALRDMLEKAQRAEMETLDPISERLQVTDDLLQQAEQEAGRIGRAMQAADPDGDVYKSIKQDEKQVNARLVELRAQRAKYIEQLGKRNLTDDRIGTIMQFADDLRLGIDNADFSNKRHTLEILQVRVDTTLGEYTLKCILGEKKGRISKMGQGKGMKGRIVPSLP